MDTALETVVLFMRQNLGETLRRRTWTILTFNSPPLESWLKDRLSSKVYVIVPFNWSLSLRWYLFEWLNTKFESPGRRLVYKFCDVMGWSEDSIMESTKENFALSSTSKCPGFRAGNKYYYCPGPGCSEGGNRYPSDKSLFLLCTFSMK